MFRTQICVPSIARTVQGTQFQNISYAVCSEINSHVHLRKTFNKFYKILYKVYIVYIFTYTYSQNTTIYQIVAICNIQLHVSAL